MKSKQKHSHKHPIEQLINKDNGTLLIEFLTIIAIVIFLTGFITFNLGTTQQHTSVNTTIDQLVADLKQQQLKAMVDDTEGRGTTDSYGIHFDSNKYTLFHGLTYSAEDNTNFVVNLDTDLQFSSITFPGSNVVFAKESGEIAGFVDGQNTLKIVNTAGSTTKTITINQYGTITSIN